MKTRMLTYPIVEVTWEDITTNGGWTKGRANRPIFCVTSGYLTYKGKKHIVVASSFNELFDYSDKTAIPRGVIKKIRRVGKASIKIQDIKPVMEEE